MQCISKIFYAENKLQSHWITTQALDKLIDILTKHVFDFKESLESLGLLFVLEF